MINWIKYDPANPPSTDVEFLVTSGPNVWVAKYSNWQKQWTTVHGYVTGVTHYAHINLPGEEDTNA